MFWVGEDNAIWLWIAFNVWWFYISTQGVLVEIRVSWTTDALIWYGLEPKADGSYFWCYLFLKRRFCYSSWQIWTAKCCVRRKGWATIFNQSHQHLTQLFLLGCVRLIVLRLAFLVFLWAWVSLVGIPVKDLEKMQATTTPGMSELYIASQPDSCENALSVFWNCFFRTPQAGERRECPYRPKVSIEEDFSGYENGFSQRVAGQLTRNNEILKLCMRQAEIGSNDSVSRHWFTRRESRAGRAAQRS